MATDQVRTAPDPTRAVLSESALDEKYLCDYVVNVATGCRHGCEFCYVPATPQIRTRPHVLAEAADVEDPQGEWGSYALYREHVPGELPGVVDRKRTWRTTEGGRGVVGISFSTDCYMDARAARITTQAVRILTDRGKFVRVLTRNPLQAATHPIRRDPAGRVTVRGADALARAPDGHLTVGSSINSLDGDAVAALEPGAPSIEARLQGLQRLSDRGIDVFVSMSPTYPTMSPADIVPLCKRLAELAPTVIFHEPINPRGGNFQAMVTAADAAGEHELAAALARIREDRERWARYAVRQLSTVQQAGARFDLPVHLWPDEGLLDLVTEPWRAWLRAWRDRQPPEAFAGRPTPDDPMPAVPDEGVIVDG